MNALECKDLIDLAEVTSAAKAACDSIAPAWPLDSSIAVNPYWGIRQSSFAEAAQQMRQLAGSPMAMPLSYYRERYSAGEITAKDVERALQETDVHFTLDELLMLPDDAPRGCEIPLLSDILDRGRNPEHSVSWREHILTQISQCCASYFDRHEAAWPVSSSQSLYLYWKEMVGADIGAELLMGVSGLRRRARMLPERADDLLKQATASLKLSPDQLLAFFRVALLRVSGWASYGAYRNWQAALDASAPTPHLLDLLAIRVAWEQLLDDGERDPGSLWSEWQIAWHSAASKPVPRTDLMASAWLRAEELSLQSRLLARLSSGATPAANTVRAQCVFCIDVRSEALRRHLEQTDSSIQTVGYAGFFGVPMNVRPLSGGPAVPHLPGLLAAKYTAVLSTGNTHRDAQLAAKLSRQREDSSLFERTSRLPASSFAFVESFGPLKLLELGKKSVRSMLSARDSGTQEIKHGLAATLEAGVQDKTALARAFLQGTALQNRLARVVVLVGHGSSTTNNPTASALDCGACCGHNGLVNARVMCQILNDPHVRASLKASGVEIPEDTQFVAAVHDTTLAAVRMDDSDPQKAGAEVLAQLREAFREACTRARRERNPASAEPDANSETRAYQRARDWAETRPEWGLANNAAFIVGRRHATRGMDLGGRCFLQEYDASRDPDGSLLEQIMTAPVVVAHWINMQYFASTVDPHRFGSGNKTLHNVVGAHIGLFEGNGGDLRFGLSTQSLHDGKAWRHSPVLLTVILYADCLQIEEVIQRHADIRHLVAGGWIDIIAASGEGFRRYSQGEWTRMTVELEGVCARRAL